MSKIILSFQCSKIKTTHQIKRSLRLLQIISNNPTFSAKLYPLIISINQITNKNPSFQTKKIHKNLWKLIIIISKINKSY